MVGDGSFIPIYLYRVAVRMGEDEFVMRVGFSAKLGVGFNLLGMDIFGRYRVILMPEQKGFFSKLMNNMNSEHRNRKKVWRKAT